MESRDFVLEVLVFFFEGRQGLLERLDLIHQGHDDWADLFSVGKVDLCGVDMSQGIGHGLNLKHS
ncbi:MAG: hypothetical protein IH820_08620 [Bacteroidetes bacterium]|nr:hypothetical protein [Bacteroidota bacterium]